MIFYLSLVKDDPFAAIVFSLSIAVALVAGISFHEFSHAFTADTLVLRAEIRSFPFDSGSTEFTWNGSYGDSLPRT